MSTEYVVVAEGLVVEHCCGARQAGKDCRDVPDGFAFVPGVPLSWYAEGWRLKSGRELVAEGLVELSLRERLEGEQIVPKSPEELALDGLEKAPKGQKLVDDEDGLRFEPMSTAERYEAGQLTREEAELLLATEARGRRNAALERTDWTEGPGARRRMGEAAAAAWDEYRDELRDVPQQGGFPLAIVWPNGPDGVTL